MSNATQTVYDLAVVGGGINGTGIARDAAGRGLKVVLLEKDDLAAHTSSWSTKLIHGGLRYLEHFEFRLVAESLAEREVLLRAAPHIIEALQFVLPHEPHLRPAWMIRAGLFLYDHIGGRRTLPSSFAVNLATSEWGAGLKRKFRQGFVYSDARVDDSRLVIINAMDARERGADILPRTALAGARRENGLWHIRTRSAAGDMNELRARALVNATGPWVKQVQDEVSGMPGREAVRHIKGSHIVVPRVHPGRHAYILQNADKRVVFVIPYQDKFSLIGTTDIPVKHYEKPTISPEEVAYLCDIASAYLSHPPSPADVVWSYSGVRPLYDDGSVDPSTVTRDYVLKLDSDPEGTTPLLSIYGGKITTYRRLAEHALTELRKFFPRMGPAWTHRATLPGGDLPGGDFAAYRAEIANLYPFLPPEYREVLLRRHGTRVKQILGDAKSLADLGRHFGDTLYASEVEYLVAQEWACDAEDILWRRTKCGLHLSEEQRGALAQHMAERFAHQ
ncbi:MAG: glycerol-3-phosphate dehydrogenase [Betaproteobacteria bacterium]|nr:MAG: glycerol-3-phosphate dehydrogenase [Betaproteobacteria bacterium]